MRFTARRGVSPIIATLLLIAIAVSASIIVYVFVNSISGSLTQQGGQQVSEQVSMDAYTFILTGTTCTGLTAGHVPCIQTVMRNIGSSTITISQVFVDGNLCQTGGATCLNLPYFTEPASGGCTTATGSLPAAGFVCPTGGYATMSLDLNGASVSAGTSHLIRVVTSDGGTFSFSTLAGRSG
jgi:flagellin-like protein